jgi:hypothetical protein
MVWQILGWGVIVWMIGSTIHSTKFHLGNYLIQKQKINNNEVGETYKHLHEQTNWRMLILFQLSKLSIAIFVVYLLIS